MNSIIIDLIKATNRGKKNDNLGFIIAYINCKNTLK